MNTTSNQHIEKAKLHSLQQSDPRNWNENSNTSNGTVGDPVGDGDSTKDSTSKQEKQAPETDSAKPKAEGVAQQGSEGA